MAYIYSTHLNKHQVAAGIDAVVSAQDFDYDESTRAAAAMVLNDLVTVNAAAAKTGSRRYAVHKLVESVIKFYVRKKALAFTLPHRGNPGSAKSAQKQESVAIYHISKASLDDCYDVLGIPRDKLREHMELIFCGRGKEDDLPWTSVAARRAVGQVDPRVLNRYIAQVNQVLRCMERVIRREKVIRDKANKWVPIHERDISEGADATMQAIAEALAKRNEEELSNTVGNEEERQPAASVTGIKPEPAPQVADRPAPIDLDNLMDSWE